eukprot:313312-Amphidinium_carterae.1
MNNLTIETRRPAQLNLHLVATLRLTVRALETLNMMCCRVTTWTADKQPNTAWESWSLMNHKGGQKTRYSPNRDYYIT